MRIIRKAVLLALLLLLADPCRSQSPIDTAALPDASRLAYNQIELPPKFRWVLGDFIITAFNDRQEKQRTPAAVSAVFQNELRRIPPVSIVQAVNQTPGVRMEERSPGSYRLSIRGSTLRAPFGVRNVKVYLNDLPFTDAGGITYLNAIGYHNINDIEILRGPGSALYGAGTGGVVLLNTVRYDTAGSASLHYLAGSYGLQQMAAKIHTASGALQTNFSYQHQQSDGYRQQSRMRQDVAHWSARYSEPSGDFTATIHYNNLQYQTPGGLTLSEYTADPHQARPGAGSAPGAVAAGAEIFQENVLGGFSMNRRLGSGFSHTAVLYASATRLLNPAIRNYARTNETGFGGRTSLNWKRSLSDNSRLELNAGGEAQQLRSDASTYKNAGGRPDSLRTDDEVRITTGFLFINGRMDYRHNWVINAGLSYNASQMRIDRAFPEPAQRFERRFNGLLAPRLSVLYRANELTSLYAVGSRGFSPPTLSELSPSGSAVNTTLSAEEGWNAELGVRGFLLKRHLRYDANFFWFGLDHAIVQRRDALGGDYYINSGGTRQAGAELALNYEAKLPRTSILNLWASYTCYHFRYRGFRQLTSDYTGNAVPGAAPHTLAAGADLEARAGLYAHLALSYLDRVPLDDANTAYGHAFATISARIGWSYAFGAATKIDLFAGGDNLTGEQYSLGYDINAFGGRYYNAAPGRNFYAGCSLAFRRPPLKKT